MRQGNIGYLYDISDRFDELDDMLGKTPELEAVSIPFCGMLRAGHDGYPVSIGWRLS
jgi:hypothetical protein